MTGGTLLLRKWFLGLTVVSIWLIWLTPPLPAAMINAVIRDDDNNLRAWGGENYRAAPVLEILNRGDHVRVWEKRGRWVYVSTPEGFYGWVNAGCLSPAPDIGWLKDMPAGLKELLGQFLVELRAAAESRNFPHLARLFAPGGLIIQARRFKDAGLDPSQQKPQVVPLWYASDVSVTMGTAWQLLIAGTRPPAAEAYWDKASHSFKVKAGTALGAGYVALDKEKPLLPTHLAALRLAPEVHFVRGFSADLEGYPGPYPFQDPRRTPFSWVLEVGPHRYLLMQFNRVGLYLVVTDRPGEGLRLRAIFTQAP
jgi:hypothetical protein